MAYDTDNFTQDVIEQSHKVPILADFWAEWCGPCRFLGPVLEKLADEANGQWELVKVNTEVHTQVATQYGISSIPNVKLFVNGEVVDEFVGALPEPQIRQWLQNAIPSKHEAAVQEAQELLMDGEAERAQRLLEVVLAAEPANEGALWVLAQSYLDSDVRKAAEIAAQIPPGSEYYDRAEAMATCSGLFAHLSTPDGLADSPVKATYLDAIHHLKGNNYDAALDGFIAVLRKDRRYDDEGARRAGIAVFKLLGDDHEITQRQRVAFSNALFV